MSGSGGWRDLARRHRAKGRFDGPLWRFRSATFQGEAQYNNVLTLGVSTQGLYVAVFPLFAFRHPPLLIPWSLVRKSGLVAWESGDVKLELGETPPVEVNISAQLLSFIEQRAPEGISMAS